MEPIRVPTRLSTAIPTRYREERERVLEILARWEAAMRAATMPLTAGPQ